MDRQAKVTSVDALTTFRSSLVIYMGSVGNALDEVRDEVRRMRTWLQVDQRAHWGGQLKRLRKQLEQAEADAREKIANINAVCTDREPFVDPSFPPIARSIGMAQGDHGDHAMRAVDMQYCEWRRPQSLTPHDGWGTCNTTTTS